MITPAVATRGLAKAYSRGPWRNPSIALHPADLELGSGQWLAVIGHNGAGKSTFLNLLVGLIRPTAGRALIHGIGAGTPASRQRVGFVPERSALPRAMSVAEFLSASAALAGLSHADGRARSRELLDQLELTGVWHERIHTLSAGTRQRLLFVQALVHRPEVLLLDEPLTGLDGSSLTRVMDTLGQLRRAGTTVVVATHRLAEWAGLCDRVAVLRSGRLLDLGSVAQICATAPVRAQFVESGATTVQTREIASDRHDAELRALLDTNARVFAVEPILRALPEDA